ncbi:hypothetical protein APA_3233 [Pseudanabaena sp. lw0831]|uniref:hypothetical protein n=1 Tax=Pseudanabaena sp. lw0831 TaxID=1357935 RepID=UPI001915FAD3|nr:hypothetical protein [Pseudanabaena sp. lw0831]GBO55183.1 hypothetical protein APA_3233 [Pseudanabaena sp. lw0831]
MLPTLADFDILSGIFIRKLNKRTHWDPQEGDNDLSLRAKLASERIFPAERKHSLWYVSTESEFYGVVASLTATATPKNRDIDFIWIEECELQEVGVIFESIPNGDCLHVKSLHIDAEINKSIFQNLCYNLMNKKREAYRCSKRQTTYILEYQRQIGCKSTDTDLKSCECQR